MCDQREELSKMYLTAMGQGDKKKAGAMKHLLDTHLRDCPNCNPQTVTVDRDALRMAFGKVGER